MSRDLLGVAIRRTVDSAVRDWIRLLLPGGIVIAVSRCQWGLGASPICKLRGCTGVKADRVSYFAKFRECGGSGSTDECVDRVVSVLKLAICGLGIDRRGFWETRVGDIWGWLLAAGPYANGKPDGVQFCVVYLHPFSVY